MSYEESIRSITLNAASSIAVKTGVPGQVAGVPNKGFQYRFVKVTGERECGLLTDATEVKVCGVLQNKPQITGAACTVAIRGVSMVESGAAFDAGDLIMTNATGQAIEATGSNIVLGVALAAATAADELVPVLLRVN